MATIKTEIRVGETLSLRGAGVTTITLLEKTGQRARFNISSSSSVQVVYPSKTKDQSEPLGLARSSS